MFESVRCSLCSLEFLDNSLWQWTLSVLIVLGGFVFAKVLFLFNKNVLSGRVKRTKTNVDDIVLKTTAGPVLFAIILASVWWAVHRLNVSADVLTFFGYLYQLLIIMNICWVITRITEGFIYEHWKNDTRKKEKIDDNRIRIIVRTIKWIVWILGILTALNNMGVNIGAVIAGLGVGGVAFALAAQDTIKNLFAGFVIFFDRPFKIGDRVNVGIYDGYVEDIGLRSVRIRLLNKQLVTVSTSSVIDAAVVNVTAEPAKRIVVKLGLTYGTTPEKMELALRILKDAPQTVEDIEKECDAYFIDYGDFSLNLQYWYYIKTGKDFFDTQSAVNLYILKEFNKNGLNFAFPTQTVYVNKQ